MSPATNRRQVDETSERWVTAVHEAGHAVTAESFGGRVTECVISPRDDREGHMRHTVTAPGPWAIIAVAGERATRLLCGVGGGATTDYEIAYDALREIGRPITWAEDHADAIVAGWRRDIVREARTLYRRGHR